MMRVVWIAWREFLATVATKGFIIGLLFTPALIGAAIFLLPRLMNDAPPKVVGEVAVIDPTRALVGRIEVWLAPEAMAERAGDLAEAIDEAMPAVLREMGEQATDQDLAAVARERILAELPEIELVSLPAGADVEAEKEALLEGSIEEGARLAIVVVHTDAIQPEAPDAEFGSYDLFVREKLDDRIEDEITGAVREAIIDARIATSGLDREQIETLTTVERVRSTTVTAEGEQETNEVLNVLLPGGFMILLLVAVMTGGQQILLTTVDEKQSRVVEVLLSAVSPMQLMAGKILGQLGVGLLMLVIYGAMGMTALISFAAFGLVDPALLFYLVIFYLIAYFTLGSWMAAVGSSVNEITEAQSLMMPVMVTMMIPWVLWVPIIRDPNGLFATVTSFVPPVNTFVMMLRISSTTPPPAWQVWGSIGIGVLGVWAALWAAAKIFRVGLLMYGKPPNLPTLIRWIRQA